ncbi:FecR domain-containing protein [Aquitalea sp. ASV11]|uniref:FecR family protein n=1 Tax=Aquitalea sp. ASV11 TaxID=2795103 RepID=UPI0018ED82F9|nr:FecR domain-containing protein [Aquitalea sp. ASV11]
MSPAPDAAVRQLQEEAARWLLRQQEGLTPQQQAEFQRWHDAAEEHRQEYAAQCRLWGALDQLAKAPARRRGRAASLGCLLLAALGGWTLLHLPVQSALFTAYGQGSSQYLADGSKLTLGGHSRVRVDYHWGERQLVVEQGMARIRVAPNPRPLRVLAGAGELRDIGTEFDVMRSGNQVAVHVQQGLVELRLAGQVLQLAAGQQASYQSQHLTGPLSAGSFDWQNETWTFNHLPLGDLLLAVNGQSAQVWRLADPSLASLLLSGSVQRDDRDGLLSMLTSMLPLQAKQQPDGTVLLSRKK